MYFLNTNMNIAIEISYLIVFACAMGNYLRISVVKNKYGGNIFFFLFI